ELLNPYEQNASGEGDGSSAGETGAGVTEDTGGAGEGFDEESFAANVAQAEGTTLVVFLTQYSLGSRELEKTLDELAEDYAERVNLVRYSVDEQPALYQRFRIRNLPLVLVYRDGKEQERRDGTISKAQLAALLDKHLETE
ncbi:MAG TPA: thioredoxin domain-containing protein, partial [Pyrinomonadaceae bacterium]